MRCIISSRSRGQPVSIYRNASECYSVAEPGSASRDHLDTSLIGHVDRSRQADAAANAESSILGSYEHNVNFLMQRDRTGIRTHGSKGAEARRKVECTAWHSGRTLVFNRRTFPVPRSTSS